MVLRYYGTVTHYLVSTVELPAITQILLIQLLQRLNLVIFYLFFVMEREYILQKAKKCGTLTKLEP